EGKSNNWTRDASNPAVPQADPFANTLYIRVNPFDPQNPCDYVLLSCTHQLNRIGCFIPGCESYFMWVQIEPQQTHTPKNAVGIAFQI
ncbi:MAG: hypothetical protein M0R69_07670, partial [Candidatus Cloacimonetes bacterium]|nr:hypothetical protein [Candidatus Cloacimonadota bacterium]